MLKSLSWRYATQIFDVEKKLSTETLDTILECTRMAPSAFGIQPFKMIVVTDPDLRKKIREVGYNQPKISEASHLVIFAVPKKVDVDSFISLVSKTRDVPVEALEGYANMIKYSLSSKTEEQKIEWFTKQAYLALGVLISAASMEGVDSAPMEGFDPKKTDELLGLEGWETKVMVALGYRSDKDTIPKKVRYPKEEIVLMI